MEYICKINKRDYSEYEYNPILHDITNPQEHHLFNNDVFIIENNEVIIKKSCTRDNKNIPGILLLEGNKTFGRNKKKLFYKCKPHDSKLPYFLIPYEMPMGFNKNFKNKYITFYFQEWEDKHPYGKISQNIGDVYNLPSFYEYQLFCKCLHDSISISISQTKKLLKDNNVESYEQEILQKTDIYGEFNLYKNEYIFSIDPDGCLDKDDAISIRKINDNKFSINIYIANVWVWLNVLNLWNVIGSRVSTIYFPDFKRPMLPTTIGETLCSLEKNTNKFVFVMEMILTLEDDVLKLDTSNIKLNQGFVKITDNYVYEEKCLLKNKSYKQLLSMTKKLDNDVLNSHDVVEFWMLKMNENVARIMREKNIGIFRTVQSKNKDYMVNNSLPFIVKVLEQQISGKYTKCILDENMEHEILGYTQYVHFTSPIRRMPDLLNQICWTYNVIKPEYINRKMMDFYETQISELDILNVKMKKIRRLQNDSHILHTVFNEMTVLDKIYTGIIISLDDDKINVYIDELQWLTSCWYDKNTQTYNKYDKIQCSLFLFEKEDQMRRKIRINIINKN